MELIFYLQAKPPGKQSSNWLPIRNGPYYTVLRIMALSLLLNKKWKPLTLKSNPINENP